MKLKRRVLSLVLALTMLLSLCCVNAFAASPETAQPDINIDIDVDVTHNPDVDVHVFSDDGSTATWNWARDYIYQALKNGFFKGDNLNCFNADKNLTRAEAVTALLAVMGETPGLLERLTLTHTQFTDADGDWYTPYVAKAAKLGITKGYAEDNTFRPNATVTREEFVTMLLAACRIEATATDCEFTDVDMNQWYAPYVCTAAAEGIVSGYPDGTFGIGKPVTRAEAAVMVVKAADRYFT